MHIRLVNGFSYPVGFPPNKYLPLATDAYKNLVGLLKAEKMMAEKKLLIVPDGALLNFPFQILRTENDKFLLEEHPITYLVSSRELVSRREGNHDIDSVHPGLALLDPDYGSKNNVSSDALEFLGGPWDQLPEVSGEGDYILKAFPNTRIMKGASAQVGVFEDINSPQLLHVGTHGFSIFDRLKSSLGQTEARERMLDFIPQYENYKHDFYNLTLDGISSGLVFAGANNPDQATSSILSSGRVKSLNLNNTDLVVLSACDAGETTRENGIDGPGGFRQSFRLAGARNLVAPFWAVDSKATAELIRLFYTNISFGYDSVESLRKAQMTMMNDKRFFFPFNWAGFMHFGLGTIPKNSQ